MAVAAFRELSLGRPAAYAVVGVPEAFEWSFVQPEVPGWTHWLASGHGTLHEAWDDVASLNHIMFGVFTAWSTLSATTRTPALTCTPS